VVLSRTLKTVIAKRRGRSRRFGPLILRVPRHGATWSNRRLHADTSATAFLGELPAFSWIVAACQHSLPRDHLPVTYTPQFHATERIEYRVKTNIHWYNDIRPPYPGFSDRAGGASRRGHVVLDSKSPTAPKRSVLMNMIFLNRL
jgi:hypothetical protein